MENLRGNLRKIEESLGKFEEFREEIILNEVSLGGSPPIKGTLGDSAQGIS